MSASLDDVYAALTAADAAGNTADAQQLSDYIRSAGSAAAPASTLSRPPTETMAQTAKNAGLTDTSGTLQFATPWKTFDTGITTPPWLQNTLAGAGETFAGLPLAAKQRWAEITGSPNAAALHEQGREFKQQNAPLNATWAGTIGRALPAVPLSFVPGLNTQMGALALGGGLGAAAPTESGGEAALNTGLGAGTALAGQWAGNKLGNWVSNRAAQPLMGWTRGSAQQAALESIGEDVPSGLSRAAGSEGPKLTGEVADAAGRRIGAALQAGRSADVDVPIGDATQNFLQTIEQSPRLTDQAREAFFKNPDVAELVSGLGESKNAAQLGDISTGLRTAADSQFNSRTGDRMLGRALGQAREHVEDLIQNSIADPAQQAAYATARGEYRNLMNLTANSSVWKSSTGDINWSAFGNRLQKIDPGGFWGKGGRLDTSPLYQAARWGQTEGVGKVAPSLIKEPVSALAYALTENPLSRATGGVLSRAGAASQVPALARPLIQALSVPPALRAGSAFYGQPRGPAAPQQ
jgi:hypothetical protein